MFKKFHYKPRTKQSQRQKQQQTSMQTNKETSKQANIQTNKQTNERTNKTQTTITPVLDIYGISMTIVYNEMGYISKRSQKYKEKVKKIQTL